MSDPPDKVGPVPLKIGEIIRLLEANGWELKRTTGSHRHFSHPDKPGLVHLAGRSSATLHPKTEASILRQAGLGKEQP
jgi:predicted RNA binding protein YcfA (HicA-like mRNA interferase family)